MATATLEKAYQELAKLPNHLRDEFGERIIGYVREFRNLKSMIDQATAELERGEGIEIEDIEQYAADIGKDGRS